MRTMALIAVSIVLALLLYLLTDGVYAEQVAHHGQIVDNSGDPKECIACHDGLIAPQAHYCTVECGFGTSHSILKDYPPREKESFYKPVESLQEKGIRLFDGKVICVSCHDLRITTKYHLIIDNSGSALCYSCHIT